MVTALRLLGYAWVAYFALIAVGALAALTYRWGARLLRRTGRLAPRDYAAIDDRVRRWTDLAFASRWSPFLLPFWLVAASLERLARAAIPDTAPGSPDEQPPAGPSLWQLPGHVGLQLAHKIIRPGTMSPPLRLVTGVAMGQLVATGLLLAVARIDPATVNVASGVQAVQMSAWVFWTVVLFLALAWSFAACGAVVMRGRFRWFVLAVLAWTTHPPWAGGALLAAWALWLAGLAALMWYRARSKDEPSTAPGFALLAAVGVWVFGYFGLALWGIERAGGAPFPEWFAGKMLSLTIFLIPLIFMAGAEMGEIGALIGRAAGSALGRTWRGWGAVVAAIVVAVSTLAWVAPQILAEGRNWTVVLASCGLVVVSLLVLTVASGISSSGSDAMPSDVPYGALATAAVGLAGAHVLVSVALSAWWLPPGAPLRATYTVVHSDTPATFSIAIPEGAELAAVDIPDSAAIVRGPLGNDAYVIVSRYPDEGAERAPFTSDRALISHFRPHASGIASTVETERFAAYEFEIPADEPTSCLAIVPRVRQRWLVHACSTSRHWEQYYSRLLIPTLRSFRDDLSAQPEDPVEIAGLAQALARTTGFSIMPLLLGWVGLHLLMPRTREPHDDRTPVPGPLRRAGLFMMTIAALAVGYFPLRPFTTIGSTVGATVSPLKDLLAVTALASLLFSLLVLAAPAMRRRTRMSSDLLAANLGLLLLAGLYELYGRALSAQDISTLVAAGLLVATLLWDLVMSGHPITNLTSAAFPRPARVMLWAGYVTMVGTGILFYSSQIATGPGASVSGMFQTDETVRQGILWLGSAVLVSTLLTGVRFHRAGGR